MKLLYETNLKVVVLNVNKIYKVILMYLILILSLAYISEWLLALLPAYSLIIAYIQLCIYVIAFLIMVVKIDEIEKEKKE